MLDARNCYQRASNAAKVRVASGITAFKHVHDRADQAIAVLDQLAITSKSKYLEQKTEAGLRQDLVAVKAEREAQLALIEKLNDLDDVLACITNSNDSRGTSVAKVGDNDWAVDERPYVVVYQGLIQLAFLC